jgi:NAD(P)H-dependent FMN reductase
MESTMFIPVFVGTSREGRQSIYVAQLVIELMKGYPEVSTELVDPKNFSFPLDGRDETATDPRYREIVKNAEGFFIVTPEYNHGVPGSLKRMLDSELSAYFYKPVAFVGVSSGLVGGARAVEQLALIVRTMKMISLPKDVLFRKVQEVFDEKGTLLDSSYVKYLKQEIEELIRFVKATKILRKQD